VVVLPWKRVISLQGHPNCDWLRAKLNGGSWI
jgi:hypothetical protein